MLSDRGLSEILPTSIASKFCLDFVFPVICIFYTFCVQLVYFSMQYNSPVQHATDIHKIVMSSVLGRRG